MARDIHAEVTERIIEALEAGKVPWSRPWNPDACGGPSAPINAVTGAAYHGLNCILLGMHPAAYETGDPRWMTYLQAQKAGYQVRKGEKATPIIFYKPLQRDEDSEPDEDRPAARAILRGFSVFHASQCDGVPTYTPPTVEECPWLRPEATEIILKNSGADIRIGGDRAFYNPIFDFIQLPPDSAFKGPEYFSAIAVHEAGHWSGHKSRLDRDLTGGKESAKYAHEEGVVEIAAAMTCAVLGLPTDYRNHAAYIGHWLPALREDDRLIFRIAAEAQKVSTYLLNFHPDYRSANSPTAIDLPRPSPAEQHTVAYR